MRLTEDPIDRILEFEFLNGKLYLDSKVYGAYAICPGCGSGKTTLIKELILMKWKEGVLYSAFTIDEVEDVHKFLSDMIKSGSSNGLKEDDIVVLHSENKKDLYEWYKNPDVLMDKKVVLCTHYKLLNEPLTLLVSTKFNNSSKFLPPLTRIMGGLQGSYPRQWILIDENTESKKSLSVVGMDFFSALGRITDKVRKVDSNGRLITVSTGELLNQRVDIYYDEYCKSVRDWAKYYKFLGRKYLKDESIPLNKLRNERFLELTYNNFQLYANTKNPYVRIVSSYTDMLMGVNLKSHVLLFDGTADITLSKSRIFTLYSFSDKYNSPVNLFKLPFDLTRKLKNPEDLTNGVLKGKLEYQVSILKRIISENKRTLIFTWKNLKSKSEDEVNDSEGELIDDENLVKPVLNEDFSLTKYIKSELEKDPKYQEGVNYSIEYYGSGRDKATNDYRDYDAVVLLGKYFVPGSVIDDFNMMFGTNITDNEYYTNRVIQAICRTRIRNHRFEPINVYMTQDWNDMIISNVKTYLGIADFKEYLISDLGFGKTFSYMYDRLRSIGITPKRAEKIAKLSKLDSGIYNAVVTKSSYDCVLKLDDVFGVLPMSRKDVDKYNSLVKCLGKLGVSVVIKS